MQSASLQLGQAVTSGPILKVPLKANAVLLQLTHTIVRSSLHGTIKMVATSDSLVPLDNTLWTMLHLAA